MNRHGGARRRRDADRESGVSAIEFVLLTPLLFFLIFATVQFALYFFARHVAIAAAQEGDRVARSEAATTDYPTWSSAAVTESNVWINRLGPNLLQGSNVLVPPGSAPGNADWTVSVTVRASVPSLFPWANFTVTETSTGPVEQFIPDTP